MSRWAVVLAGGVGSRFWPLSTPSRPKQLLPLVTSEPLLADAVARLAPIAPPDRVLILTNESLVPAIARAAARAFRAENLIAEPRAGGTAAALAWAAHEIARRDGPDAVMISRPRRLGGRRRRRVSRARSTRAADVAEQHHALVTVGVVPTRADPGFGYIQPGQRARAGRATASRASSRSRTATRAERDAARRLPVELGDLRVARRRLPRRRAPLTPEIAPALHAHAGRHSRLLQRRDAGLGRRRRARAQRRVVVLPGDFGWDDVGTWAALTRVRAPTRGQRGAAAACTPSTRATTWCTRRASRSCCTACRTSSSSSRTGSRS